jgi:hypothetical protein
MTVTPGVTAPVWSVTVPTIALVALWPSAVLATLSSRATQPKPEIILNQVDDFLIANALVEIIFNTPIYLCRRIVVFVPKKSGVSFSSLEARLPPLR